MTWIRVDTSLARHPKTSRFAKAMGLSRHEAMGVLVDLWLWSVEYADDGDLSRYTSDELLSALGVGNRQALIEYDLIEALTSSGFVDADGQRLELHGWAEHQGPLIQQREANRERNRRYRKRKRDDPERITSASRDAATNERTDEQTDVPRTRAQGGEPKPLGEVLADLEGPIAARLRGDT